MNETDDRPAPLVTVLMPVYNGEKYLGAAIESVLAQTMPDFELLVVDDGSTDGSAAIAASYRDARVRFVGSERNAGITATLNRGVALARAELVARMDADDLCRPARLARQLDFMRANPSCALVSAWTREIDERGREVAHNRWPSAHYYYNLAFHCWIYHPSVMFRRVAVRAVGGYRWPVCEDYELWQRLARRYRIWNIEETLLDYRLTEISLTRETKKKEYADAQTRVVAANVEHFTNGSLALSADELAFLQNDCAGLIAAGGAAAAARCFGALDEITKAIARTPNVNLDPAAVAAAAETKKSALIAAARAHLPKSGQLELLARLGAWGELARLGAGRLRRAAGKAAREP